jgi:chromosome segregation ATPase
MPSQESELEALNASIARLEQERDAARAEVATTSSELTSLSSRLKDMSTELVAAKNEVATASSELTILSKRLEETSAELVAARDEAERWQEESKRRELELDGQFRVEQQRESQRQARLIVPPLREACEHLLGLLTSDRRNEPLRRLAVSFDSLQKNLGRVLGVTEIQRLPQEFLARSEEGVNTSENAD